MRTRKIETFYDSDNKKHTNIVWFKSSGKLKTNTQAQVIDLIASEQEKSIEGLVTNQKYNITVTSIQPNSKLLIQFYNNDSLVDSFNFISLSNFVGTLSQPVTKITISSNNSTDSVNIVFHDISEIVYTDNFDIDKDAIKSVLTQKLSVLQNELWFDFLYGMPIVNKLKSKLAIDSFIIQTVQQQEYVKSIKEFTSKIENKQYFCNMTIESTFGDLTLNI